MGIELVTTKSALRDRLTEFVRDGFVTSVGFVPTMGALHAGHAALASQAARDNDLALASIFVNPLQFGEAVDLERYPRTLDADLELLEAAGVRLVFAPSVEEMYPAGQPGVRVSAGPLATVWEGASRPGHFDGALTVVAKLLHLTQAPVPVNRAYFGQKDAQQLALVRQMADDLDFGTEIVPVPIVRDADGLALSSRNRFLSDAERESALVLSRALRLLEERAAAHEPLDLDSAVALVESAPGVELDYFDVVDPRTLEPLAENCRFTPFRGEALAIIAAAVGPVRLIDNALLNS
ncbi:pantoate--beta-alanine ligase [Arthrobacter sp. NPDC090010]|uniref:pantoate--beta-alanine ligase n=1 Tax=Arthrobacter sp. NPDC090010 TaxID=3363942 RepID=UPI003823B646